MDICNVTCLYKNKGDKNMFDSHRGVFRTTILRNILERLIYNDEYNTVDAGLTDCNVGCRKKRNVRDNLFVINAVTNSSKKVTDNPCDICVYDVRKCFETLSMSECINDLYEYGLTNDKLCLLFHANKSARIAINLQVESLKGSPYTTKLCRELCGRYSCALALWTSSEKQHTKTSNFCTNIKKIMLMYPL